MPRPRIPWRICKKQQTERSARSRGGILLIHIFIDLEFCTCFRKSSPLRTETIEIGAVKVDENNRITGEFDSLVRPDFANSIPSAERNLTGITWQMVENERTFCDVMEEFVGWIGTDDYMIYSWSNNDPLQVLREARVKGFPATEMGMFKKWIDFQQVFMASVGMKNQVSLEHAIELADMYFVGEAHRAVVDSFNTARLFIYCNTLDTVELKLRTIDENGTFGANLMPGSRKKTGNGHGGRNGRRNIGSSGAVKRDREDTAYLAAGSKPKAAAAGAGDEDGTSEKKQSKPSRKRSGRAHRGGRKKKTVV